MPHSAAIRILISLWWVGSCLFFWENTCIVSSVSEHSLCILRLETRNSTFSFLFCLTLSLDTLQKCLMFRHCVTAILWETPPTQKFAIRNFHSTHSGEFMPLKLTNFKITNYPKKPIFQFVLIESSFIIAIQFEFVSTGKYSVRKVWS